MAHPTAAVTPVSLPSSTRARHGSGHGDMNGRGRATNELWVVPGVPTCDGEVLMVVGGERGQWLKGGSFLLC
ncbi:hypothetical protein ERO13_A12G126600v2 [Gossypium hirsutum]|uniref:Uncharacterized protein n=1 Tax=Gossypium mustelinum TaxID=34275 RepID=A0A5D2WTS4_GOSMU|nr:hypothetical protein ERO13_A12G126600v2 [Gossypium hirsutum]TYJ05034.1 hypothetical protein E1A91_A12G137500v1 [Gossypium mustelinum]